MANNVEELKSQVGRKIERMRPGDKVAAGVPGLYVRSQGRRKVFAFRYRLNGKDRTLTGAEWLDPAWYVDTDAEKRERLVSAWTLDRAWAWAQQAREQVARGIDPTLGEIDDPTINQLAELYIEQWAKPHKRSWGEDKRRLDSIVTPDWGARKARAITRREVVSLVNRAAQNRGPAEANRLLALVRRMFNWAIEQSLLDPPSPASHVKRPGVEKQRERVLSDDELRAIWNAADEYPHGSLVRFILLTAARKGEAGRMRWSEVYDDVWMIPAERSKSGRGHEIPLTSQALALLDALPRDSDDNDADVGVYAFSTTRGKKPFGNFSKCKRELDKAADVTGWTLHDLRRTVATRLAALGHAQTVPYILGHTRQDVTAIYDRYGRLDEKRDALKAWARELNRIVRKRKG